MGRHAQQSLLLHDLQLSIGLERMPSPFLDWRWVQALFCTGHNQKEEMGSIKRGKSRGIGGRLLCCWSAPMSRECLCSKRSVCLCWIELNLSVVLNPLFCPSKFLLQWDKNWGREIKLTWRVNILKLILLQSILWSSWLQSAPCLVKGLYLVKWFRFSYLTVRGLSGFAFVGYLSLY